VAAHGRHKRHQGAEAIALDGTLAGAIGQFGHSVQRVLDIFDAGVTIILDKAEGRAASQSAT